MMHERGFELTVGAVLDRDREQLGQRHRLAEEYAVGVCSCATTSPASRRRT